MASSAIKAQISDDHQDLHEIIDLVNDTVFFTPISQIGTTKSNAISVEKYTDDKNLHRALMASLFETSISKTFIDLSNEKPRNYFTDQVQISNFRSIQTPLTHKRKPFSNFSVSETGESSNSSNPESKSKPDPFFVCEICTEPRKSNDSFSIMGCNHFYCSDCMVKYVAAKLQENVTKMACPVSECEGKLEPEYCRKILPAEVFERWGNALCEAVINESERFYCPYKDCSCLLIDDCGEIVRQSECPNCRRLFCAQCKVGWHEGIECGEFQKLKKNEREREDLMVMKLAQDNKWIRCPKCRFFVEKVDGCMIVTCRCGAQFCYGCGGHQATQIHYCLACRR